jgi:LPXTG-site transpeptidase (sortase) family protein
MEVKPLRRKLFIALGVTSPFVILAVCAVALLLASIGGWLLFGEDEESRLVRIMSLGPLRTSEVASPQIAANPAAPAVEAAPAPLPLTNAPGQPIPLESAPSLPPEVVEQQLGFALPPGSVNSITQQGVATRLVIPKLNLDAPVILSPIENQTWKVDHLGESYVGHLEGTAPPGSESNIVLAAHVTIAAGVYGPFAGLSNLSAGDLIVVYYGDQAFEYMVDNYQKVDRTAVEVTYPSSTGQVTLITCTNWDRQAGRYVERLIVKGHLVKG